jgi:hypothetical protein
MENLIWIWFYRSQNFKLFGFLFWASLMKVIPEMRCAH